MDFYLAQIMAFGFNWAPMGFLTCDGSLLSIQQNSALYSLLGVNFGGDGRSNFGIPDLRGRTIIGQGIGTGLTPRSIGSQGMGGVEQVALSSAQLPAHTHTAAFTGSSITIKVNTATGATSTPGPRGGNCIGSLSSGIVMYNSTTPDTEINVGGPTATGTVAVGSAGQGTPVSVMQPFTVLNYCIVTQGLYPSRP